MPRENCWTDSEKEISKNPSERSSDNSSFVEKESELRAKVYLAHKAFDQCRLFKYENGKKKIVQNKQMPLLIEFMNTVNLLKLA